MGGCGTRYYRLRAVVPRMLMITGGTGASVFACRQAMQLNGRLVPRCFDAITASNADAEGDDDNQGTETGWWNNFCFRVAVAVERSSRCNQLAYSVIR